MRASINQDKVKDRNDIKAAAVARRAQIAGLKAVWQDRDNQIAQENLKVVTGGTMIASRRSRHADAKNTPK